MATQLPSINDLLSEAVKAFEENFGRKPEIAACAPGKLTSAQIQLNV